METTTMFAFLGTAARPRPIDAHAHVRRDWQPMTARLTVLPKVSDNNTGVSAHERRHRH